MRFFVALVVFSTVIGVISPVTPNIGSSWAQDKAAAASAQSTAKPAAPPAKPEIAATPAATPATPPATTATGPATPAPSPATVATAPATPAPPPATVATPGEKGAASPSSAKALWDAVNTSRGTMIWAGVVAAIIIIGGAILLYRAIQAGADPLILRLTPSFFFWLGMTYTGVLLLMAAVYNLILPDPNRPVMFGVLPIAVPWFGALGAVTISLEGVFLWNSQWDKKFNYWHIGRPLFGAVLGIVAFFIYVVIVSASGAVPNFLGGAQAPIKDYIVFYVVAFLVGYREETFRELIKRATDLILKPGTQSPAAPAVTLKVAGATPVAIQCPDVAATVTSSVTVDVQNSGTGALMAPVVTVTSVAPTAAGTFAVANDHVTGAGDLAAGQARSLDVRFTPPAAGTFAATLTVTATNLATPKTIRITGKTTPA